MTLEERSTVKSIVDSLHEEFGGKDAISVDEFAKFLDKTRTYVCNSIRAHLLPGQKIGGKFIIPVGSIALWEYRLSKTKEMESNY